MEQAETNGKIMQFAKYQAGGSDLVFVNNMENKYPFLTHNKPLIAKLLDRNFGIGGNGLAELLPCPGYAYYMQFYNPDGSTGPLCGDASLCSIIYAQREKIIAEKECHFKTVDGPHRVKIIDGKTAKKFVEVQIETKAKVQTLSDTDYFINVGTAHFVRFVKDLADYPVLADGRRISKVYQDIGGTSANFVKLDKTDAGTRRINVRIYEKGVGDEILSCGSGSLSVAMVAYWREFEQKRKDK